MFFCEIVEGVFRSDHQVVIGLVFFFVLNLSFLILQAWNWQTKDMRNE